MDTQKSTFAPRSDERPIVKFPKVRHANKSKAEKWGVNRRAWVERRDIRVLGTGKCGTMFMASCLDGVNHERVGPRGTVSHFFYKDHDWYPAYPWDNFRKAHTGERMSDYEFGVTVAMVRHPLSCVASIVQMFPSMDWEYAESTGIMPPVDLHRVRRAMLYWMNMNQYIQRNCTDVFLRLEFLAQDWHLLTSAGIPDPAPDMENRKPMNARSGFKCTGNYTWGQLMRCDKLAAQTMQKMCAEYGYED